MLKECFISEHMSNREIERTCRLFNEYKCQRGNVIFEEGDLIEYFYFFLEGEGLIPKRIKNKYKEILILSGK